MIITCEQCQARFRLADEKLKAEGTKVRCSKCKHVFTVLPPEAPPADEAIDFGDFNMERVADEEPPPPAPAPASPEAAPAAAGELDFSDLEQTLAPGTSGPELSEEFSFADTSQPAPPAGETAVAGDRPAAADDLDFDATFAERDDAATLAAAPAANDDDSAFALSGPEGEFSFDTGGDSPADDLFGFTETPAADVPAGFDAGPGEFDFGGDAPEETLTFDEPAASAWEAPAGDGPSFDFDEPRFDTQAAAAAPAPRDDGAGLKFGEIDFADEGAAEQPGFGAEPDFSQASLARPAEPDTPPPPPEPPAPRPAASRPRGDEAFAAPPAPRKGPVGKVLGLLVLLLLVLAGAGGYYYFSGNAEKLFADLLRQVKGEAPPGPVEQRIGLAIAGSSYVDNRDAGQLLVIQGTATNNFAGARSAMTVKGLILDAGGKVLQQQTVFCGNYLSEEKLAGLKYAQIEEAMNNQFGDSLSNMNVKPGGALRFTIVFRNVPRELASINVEVVDSKPGGL